MRNSYLLIIMLGICGMLNAQLTTTTISGTVKDANKQPIEGTTIAVIQTTSGTTYKTISGKLGVFNLPNLNVGGFYKVTFTNVGFSNLEFDSINLTLGTPLTINAVLQVNSGALNEIVVSTNGKGLISSKRNGTATNISQRQMQTLPSINRSVQDFARLNPQANTSTGPHDDSGRGISF